MRFVEQTKPPLPITWTRIGRYHSEYDRGADKPYTSPLFNERSLFLPEAPA